MSKATAHAKWKWIFLFASFCYFMRARAKSAKRWYNMLTQITVSWCYLYTSSHGLYDKNKRFLSATVCQILPITLT